MKLLTEMRPRGYRLFAAWEGGGIVAVAGVGVLTNSYYGRHVFVCELVTTEGSRSGGYGEALMACVEAPATRAARRPRLPAVASAKGPLR